MSPAPVERVESRSPEVSIPAPLRDPARSLFVLFSSGLLALTIVGVPLGMLGLFDRWTVALTMAISWPVSALALVRCTHRQNPRNTDASSWIAVLVALSFTFFVAANSGEHLLTNRDPGVYLMTATWMAEHGDLLYDPGLPEQIDGNTFVPQRRLPQGTYATGDGTAYFQFQHGPAVALATARWVGGSSLMLRATAILAGVGLLGLYLLGRKLTRGDFALLPLTAAAVHPAFIHVSKDAYSEMLALLFVVTAALAWLSQSRTKTRSSMFLTGLIFGATSLTRIDAWLIGIGLVVGLTYMVIGDDRRSRLSGNEMFSLVSGFLVTSLIGLLDLWLRSPEYLEDLGPSAFPLIGVFGATVVTGLLLAAGFRPSEQLARRIRGFIAPLVSIGFAGMALFALFLRSHLQVARSGRLNSFVAGLQAREGLPIDASRTYAEQSLEWFARYQGYLPITFAVLSIALGSFLVLRRRGDPRTPILSILFVVAAVYLWRPSITPDHLWAMRRFVPVVLPLGFVVMAWSVRFLIRKVRQPMATVAFGAVMAMAIVSSVAAGWPVASIGTQVGVRNLIAEICQALPTNAVVLFDDSARVMAGPVRTMCGVPVSASAETGIGDRLEEAGFRPVRLSTQATCASELGAFEVRYEYPERTLEGTPDGPESEVVSAFLTDATGSTEDLSIPDDADAVLVTEVETDWTPDSGSSVLAAVGGYRGGMWLEYRPNGVVEAWVTTEAGSVGVVASPPIDDGTTRTIGVYLLDGVLYGFCGGQQLGSRELAAPPTFEDDDVDLRPVTDGDHANRVFQGAVSVLEAELDSSLIGTK